MAYLEIVLDSIDEVCYTEQDIANEDVSSHTAAEYHKCNETGSARYCGLRQTLPPKAGQVSREGNGILIWQITGHSAFRDTVSGCERREFGTTDPLKEENPMDQNAADRKLGRFLSLVLRHNPGAAGISLDEHGWADVEELLNGVRHTGRQIDMETLERIVRENNKQRYSFNENHTRIRANQGHSLHVDVELRQVEPPQYLYHGTATRFLPAIQAEGIKKMSRQYVHLSNDYQTAATVGRRHGMPVVLRINAEMMARNGAKFYRSENGVWLCEYVPPECFCAIGPEWAKQP